jgi:ubiquinone/menaquinone biosynthesis C-methylase UbiE
MHGLGKYKPEELMKTMETRSEDYYQNWAEFYDPIYLNNREDIPFYTQEAQKAGGKVLEVACGTGRVYLELLKAGVEAYGLDFSGPMLKVLERKAASLNLQPRVQLADMKNFKIKARFALIIIPFRAFLHNLTAEDQLRTLKNCRRHLAENGKMMLNFFFPKPEIMVNNYGKDLQTTLGISGQQVEHITNSHFLDEPEQILEVTEVLRKDGVDILNNSFQLTLLYKREFVLLLRLAGFSRWRVYGGFNYQPLTSSKQEMVWVIER